MGGAKRFLLGRLVFVLWLIEVFRRAVGRVFTEAEALFGRPFEGLPTRVERLDGSKDRANMREVVLCARGASGLLLGGVLGPGNRRMWLQHRIRSLPTGSDISYVMHYWDRRGVRQSLLTRDPRRGLRPPAAPRPFGPCRSRVVAAYQADTDVTAAVRSVSASFHEDEPPVCPVALDAYLRHRVGVSIRGSPVVVTDGTLSERRIGLME